MKGRSGVEGEGKGRDKYCGWRGGVVDGCERRKGGWVLMRWRVEGKDLG